MLSIYAILGSVSKDDLSTERSHEMLYRTNVDNVFLQFFAKLLYFRRSSMFFSNIFPQSSRQIKVQMGESTLIISFIKGKDADSGGK